MYINVVFFAPLEKSILFFLEWGKCSGSCGISVNMNNTIRLNDAKVCLLRICCIIMCKYRYSLTHTVFHFEFNLFKKSFCPAQPSKLRGSKPFNLFPDKGSKIYSNKIEIFTSKFWLKEWSYSQEASSALIVAKLALLNVKKILKVINE